MNSSFVFFCFTVENIIMSMCIVRAACETGNWWLMFFLILPFVNHPKIQYINLGDVEGGEVEGDEDEQN